MATAQPVWHGPRGDRLKKNSPLSGMFCTTDQHEHECRNDNCSWLATHGTRLVWRHDRCSSGYEADHECPECGQWNGHRTDGSPET